MTAFVALAVIAVASSIAALRVPVAPALEGYPLNRSLCPRPRAQWQSVLMGAAGACCRVDHFEGTFYGVHVSVALNMETQVATVTLRGVPLVGSIEGEGSWLRDAGGGESDVLELEAEFAARLARRFVRIDGAELDPERATVTVHAVLPLLGARSLVLVRSSDGQYGA